MENPLLNATTEGRSDAPLRADMRLFHGRYVLRKQLGAGGMGVVWLAEDLHLNGKSFALKFLPGVRTWSEEDLNRLKREVLIAQDLHHEHVVVTHGFEFEPPYAAMVMEHLEGRTLKQMLQASETKFLTVAEVRPWAVALVSALRYLHHTKKHVHRDIKPANVMLTRAGVLKLMDFGISDQARHTLSQHATIDNGSSHTLSCASPQQLRGDRPAETDDIYSLGALLYELLGGRPPFFRGNSDVVGYQIRHEEAPSIAKRREELRLDAEAGAPQDEVPSAWEDVVAACLEKDPVARPTLDDLARVFSAPPKPKPVKRDEPPAPVAQPAPQSGSSKKPTEKRPVPAPASQPQPTRQAAQVPRKAETETAGVQHRAARRMWMAAAAVVLAGGAYYALSGPDRMEVAEVAEPAVPHVSPPGPKPPAPAPRLFPTEAEALRVARRYYEVADRPDWQQQRRQLWAPEVSYFHEKLDLGQIERKERNHRALWDVDNYDVQDAKVTGRMGSSGSLAITLKVALDFSSPAQSLRGTRKATLIVGLYSGKTLIESITSERVGGDASHIDPEAQKREIESFLDKMIAVGNKTEGSPKTAVNFDDFYDSRIDRFFDEPNEPKKGKSMVDIIANSEKEMDDKTVSRTYWWTQPTRTLTAGKFGDELLTMQGEIGWQVGYPNRAPLTGTSVQNVRIIFYGRPRVRAIWLEK